MVGSNRILHYIGEYWDILIQIE